MWVLSCYQITTLGQVGKTKRRLRQRLILIGRQKKKWVPNGLTFNKYEPTRGQGNKKMT